MKKLFFLYFTFLSLISFAQEPEQKAEPSLQIKKFKHSVKISAGLPIILSNEPFRKSMDGIYSVNGCADFSIYQPIIAGVFYNLSMFDNAEQKGNKGRRPDVTKGFIQSAGVSIGYEKFIEDNKVISITANCGYSWLNYKKSISFTDTVTNLLRTEALNFGITAAYSIVIEESGAIGFFLSYRYADSVFEPKKIDFLYDESEKKIQFMTLGIVFVLGY